MQHSPPTPVLENRAVRVSPALLWATGRLVLVLAIAYLLRKPLLDAFEAVFDIIQITEFAIDRMATPLTRVTLAVGAAIGYFVTAKACGRLFPRHAYLASLIIAGLITAGLVWKLKGSPLAFAAVMVLLATNWARLSALARVGLGGAGLGRLIAIPPGISEIFLTGRYYDWVRALIRHESAPASNEEPRLAPAAVIAALALAALAPGTKLIRYEQAMRSGPDVRVIATGDFNDIAFDARENRLLATGHGVPRVLAFDAANLTTRPLKSEVNTGAAQGFAFDPANGELFVYNDTSHEILVINTSNLSLKRKIAAPGIAPGDSWIGLCPISQTLVIASEADERHGDPFMLMDRASGTVLDKRDLEAGNILVNPEKPILYASFFRRVNGLIAYDLQTRQILAKAPSDARVDRMAYDPKRKELLLASPMEGRILSYDSLTLAAGSPLISRSWMLRRP